MAITPAVNLERHGAIMAPRQAKRRTARAEPADGGNRARILDAAAQLFMARGYQGTSIAAIAEEVGITPPAVYWHFDSKAELLGEVLESALRTFIERVIAASIDGSPGEQLRNLATEHVRFQLDQLTVARVYSQTVYGMTLLSNSLPDEHRERIQEIQRRYTNHVKDIIQRGMATGLFHLADAAPATFAIMHMCEHANWWFQPDGSLSSEDVAQMYGEFALRLVTSRPVSRTPFPSHEEAGGSA